MAEVAKHAHTHSQIKVALSKLEAGCSARAVSREYGISLRTLYRWRANEGSKPRRPEDRLRSLEAEHRRLQQQFAELALDYSTLRAALMKDVKGDC